MVCSRSSSLEGEDWSQQQLFWPKSSQTRQSKHKGFYYLTWQRPGFYIFDPPTGFPAIEECACGSVLDQLLQQQCYQIDNKNIFQPFDNAYVTARVDTGRARVPAPIE